MPARVKIKYPPRPIVKVNKALTRLDSVPAFSGRDADVSRPPQASGELALMRGEAQKWRGEIVPR